MEAEAAAETAAATVGISLLTLAEPLRAEAAAIWKGAESRRQKERREREKALPRQECKRAGREENEANARSVCRLHG